ncbi:putative photosynthetic complex assembly protein PuhE [Sphingomonas rosea]|uniref:Photosynthetic complex assembly protein PuhE n=1 Tax=Sphingomonas rosea TaxID=335605 RepID=A0ABP7U5B9_9SPHN
MSLSGHLVPALAVLLSWFASTALVVWLVHRPRATYRSAMMATSVAAIAGMAVIVATRHDDGIAATYASAAGALVIWAWQELAFLTGAAAGPRRLPKSVGAAGFLRFRQATEALLWHELALAGLLALLVMIGWGAANQVAASIFGLLFVLRLGAKLSIFSGVPNFSDELIPAHLRYLHSYFGPRRLSATLVIALGSSLLLATLLADRALSAGAGSAAIAPSLVFALAGLGALELFFLALPVRDGVLWHWAMRPGATRIAGQA